MKELFDMVEATDFEKSVWLAAAAIKQGEVRTYGWLARKIGRPKAYRAVGTALKNNPFPFIVPCHRVIREDGDLGGFAGGKAMKRLLLGMEG